jgi:hypothetical protein
MGYTHYWYQKPGLDDRQFIAFRGDVEKILRNCGVDLVDRYESDAKPVINDFEIRFNGVGGDAHEDFLFQRDKLGRANDRGEAFTFCKTNQKPYDIVVCAVLIAAKKHFGDDLKVTSDGDEADWAAGLDLADRLLGYTGRIKDAVDGRDLEVD